MFKQFSVLFTKFQMLLKKYSTRKIMLFLFFYFEVRPTHDTSVAQGTNCISPRDNIKR